MKSTIERALVILLCAAIGAWYLWTVRSNAEPWNFGQEQRDYYNLLIDGYLEGHLHMKVDVPEALLRLQNPYDPAERPLGLGLHDASFYKGKYYVYFGVAPMVVLMLPFRLITGVDLPQAVAALVFIYGGFLASVIVWLDLRRRYFATVGTLVVLLGILVLGLAGVGLVLLRRPHMWELPIGGGYGFAMLAVLCVWRSLRAASARKAWFAGAGLCLGLAIASRPTYLFAVPLLAVPLTWWWWQRDNGAKRRWPWREAFAAAVPLFCVGSLMAWHNHARFDHPLEFGQRYQFSLDYESKLPHFQAAYVPYNVRMHFFTPAKWTRYFPFLRRGDLGQAPKGYTAHRGDIYGLLVAFPVTWLALLAPLAWWRREALERGTLIAFVAVVAVLFASAATLMLFFFSALARYQMDFAPALVLLACIGLLGLERWLQSVANGPSRFGARVLYATAGLFSALFGVLYSLQFDGLLHEKNPRLEEEVARVFNRVPATFERLAGVHHGPVEVAFRLPSDRTPRSETLLTSGDPPHIDRVFVRYLPAEKIQFGVTTAGGPEQLTRPLVVDGTNSHRLRISLGSLFPPTSHPLFAGWPATDIRMATRQVLLELDGEPLLVAHQRSEGVATGHVRIGKRALGNVAAPRFRGDVFESRAAGDRPGIGPCTGFVRLRFAYKSAQGDGCEPLISLGPEGSGVLLTATRSADGQARFALINAGSGVRHQTDARSIAAGRVHELVLRVMNVTAGGQRLFLWLDGELLLAPSAGPTNVEVRVLSVGRNAAGVAECAAAFGGAIVSLQSNAAGVDPLSRSSEAVRLRLRLPTGRNQQSEPLVITGKPGAGDLLSIEYVDDRHVRFHLDHWGSALQSSLPIEIDFAAVHDLTIAMSSLATVTDATVEKAERRGRVQVTLDGAVVWTYDGLLYIAESEEVAFGFNSIGGTSCGPRFTGDVLEADRIGRE